MWKCFSVLAVACGFVFSSATIAGAATAPEFPIDQDSWVNSSPISLSLLEGKAAFLWFYEET